MENNNLEIKLERLSGDFRVLTQRLESLEKTCTRLSGDIEGLNKTLTENYVEKSRYSIVERGVFTTIGAILLGVLYAVLSAIGIKIK